MGFTSSQVIVDVQISILSKCIKDWEKIKS